MKRNSVIVAVIGLISSLLLTSALAASAERLEEKALVAMQEGDYTKASHLLGKRLEQQPGNPRVLYNLACCLSRLGELELAAERLEQAWQAGLRDPELVRSDQDLQALRDSRKGSELINRLATEEERLRRLRGMPHYFETQTLGGLRVVAPTQIEKDRNYPLVIILHGHGANPENYAGLFEFADASLEAIVTAPYGPYPIFHEQGRGYSWYPAPWFYRELLVTGGEAEDRERRREEIESSEQKVSEAYVKTAIDAVRARYPVDPEQIYLMGHSEGGVLAYGLALKNHGLIRGLIVVGARLRERDASAELLSDAAGKLQVLICHSPEDRAIEFETAKTAHKLLKQAGIQSKVVSYAGGHRITTELARTIAQWISDPDRQMKPGD